ncbi:MAG: hypothetical protein JWN48_1196 [Myxococcaceae bacterium]|nr:hypothetical protein [Myxococcaceae bacterium]
MPHESLADLSAEVGLAFPAGTRLLGVHRESGIDDLLAVKVELSERHLDSLLHGSSLAQEQLQPSSGSVCTDVWQEKRLTGLRTAQASLPDARVLDVGVRPEGNGVITVFIANFGT